MRLIKLSGTGMEITPAIRAYVEERLLQGAGKFTQHQDAEGTGMMVEVGRTSNHHKNGDVYRCECQIDLPGKHMLRAEETKDDLYAAIDAVKDDMIRLLRDHEKKSRSKERRGGAIMKKLRSYIPFLGGEDIAE